MTDIVEERFWEKVARGAFDECWEWSASRTQQGYGQFRMAGKSVRAHRAAWELANGSIPDGLFVCHRCDNPPCCNPAHLFLGTAEDNVRDMVAKGRHVRPLRDESAVKFPKGVECHAAKLTEEGVIDIRRRYDAGERGTAIAADFGVSRSLITLVGKRRAWRHVPEEAQYA
jgi:hypothetical protein